MGSSSKVVVKVEAARALLAYGANRSADLSKLRVSENAADMEVEASGAGSLLIYAAASGDPEMIREILQYHPKLEGRDREAKNCAVRGGRVWLWGQERRARTMRSHSCGSRRRHECTRRRREYPIT